MPEYNLLNLVIETQLTDMHPKKKASKFSSVSFTAFFYLIIFANN